MTLLNILAEETVLETQAKILKIRLIQDIIKSLQESIILDIKQKNYIIELRLNSQNPEYINEYIPHPADSARDIKILDARISSKQQKVISMQQEIARILHRTGTIEILEGVAAA